MTGTITKTRRPRPTRQDQPSKSTSPALPPTKARRRPLLIPAGVAVAIVGGLTSWYLIATVGDSTTVLTVKSAIARGQEITADDLSTLQIAGGQATSALLATDSSKAIGQIATVDLPPGSLLTSANIGDGLVVTPGSSVVGVSLTAAQMPSQPLAAGDQVRLVDTPISQGDPPESSPHSFTATVFAVKEDPQNSQWIVDVVVPRSEAPDIAARAATGRVALVLDAGE